MKISDSNMDCLGGSCDLSFEQKQELVRLLHREVQTYRMWERSARVLGDCGRIEIATELARRRLFFEWLI